MASAGGGSLCTRTNDPSGNAVQRFERGRDGALRPAGTFPTGGAGLATLGGRQGAVALSGDGRSLYAINAGSDSVSVFRTGHRGPRLVARVASRGIARHRAASRRRASPSTRAASTSWTREARRTSPRSGAASTVRSRRSPGGTRELALGALGAAQVSVTPDGRSLVVSGRVANRLETLPLDFLGRPGSPVVTASSGTVPFGFGITPHGAIVVSEAGASTVSSYRAGRHGALRNVTASLAVGQGAACWDAVAPSGRFAYAGNASGSVSAFAIGCDGALSSLNTTALVPSPRDLAFDASGRYLYAVSPAAPRPVGWSRATGSPMTARSRPRAPGRRPRGSPAPRRPDPLRRGRPRRPRRSL
jgi:6-phosphogluconolactonase